MNITDKKFRINFLSFIRPGILPLILFLFSVIIFVPILLYTLGTDKEIGALIITIMVTGFTGIPPLVLNINYYINDRNKFIEINNTGKFFILQKGNEKQIIKFEMIKYIEKYHSGLENKKEGVSQKIHWVYYYYYKIILQNEQQVFISRLLIEKLEEKIQGIEFKNVRVAFPYIRKSIW